MVDRSGSGDARAGGPHGTGVPPASPPRLPGPVWMRQTWYDLTLLHWPLEPAAVAHLLPEGTEPDLYGGRTYVGLVALRAEATLLAGAVPMPGFGEVNVRLYTRDGRGRQGVAFRSLDVTRADLVLGGLLGPGLPYRWSRIRRDAGPAEVAWRCERRRPGPAGATRLRVRRGVPCPAPDPLEVFLTARWGLHARRLGRTWWLPMSHEELPLYRGGLVALDDGLLTAAGIEVGGEPVSVLTVPRAHAALGRPVPVTLGGSAARGRARRAAPAPPPPAP